ncbi:MAG: cell division protein FtsB [Thiohalomonadales bacterium]
MATVRMSNSKILRQHDEGEWQLLLKILVAVLVVLLFLLQFKLWFGHGNLQEVWHLQDAIENQKFDNARLKHRNDALKAEVDDLKKGLAAIEERARKELGMVKKGETFYQIVERPSTMHENTPYESRD